MNLPSQAETSQHDTGLRVVHVNGLSGMRALAAEADAAGIVPTRIEHQLVWLAEDAHGDGTTGGAIAMYRGATLSGYLPYLYRTKYRLNLRLGELALGSLPMRIVQTFGSLVVGDEQSIARGVAALAELPLVHDAVTIEESPREGPGWKAASRLVPGTFLKVIRGQQPHFLVRLPATVAAYEAKFSKKSRYNNTRRHRQLEEALGPLKLLVFTEPEQVLPVLTDLAPLARRTYHYRLLGKDTTPANASFVASLTCWARNGWLRGYALVGRDGPIAYTIGYLVNRVYFYEMPGYDPDHAALSPGNELLSQLIDELITGGHADCVDFGAGDGQYKRYFGNDSYEEIAVMLIRRRPWALLATTCERLFFWTSRGSGRLLDRLQLKSVVKKFLRRERD